MQAWEEIQEPKPAMMHSKSDTTEVHCTAFITHPQQLPDPPSLAP